MEITRPSIIRLARRAGVKSISEECFDPIRTVMIKRLEEIVKTALVLNSQNQTKTLMAEHIYDALSIQGENLTKSNNLSTATINK